MNSPKKFEYQFREVTNYRRRGLREQKENALLERASQELLGKDTQILGREWPRKKVEIFFIG